MGRGSRFLLRVIGKRMTGGATLLVDRGMTARNGDMVAVNIDGELSVGWLESVRPIRLRLGGISYAPKDSGNTEVWGVIVAGASCPS